jgi:hypothetical protein
MATAQAIRSLNHIFVVGIWAGKTDTSSAEVSGMTAKPSSEPSRAADVSDLEDIVLAMGTTSGEEGFDSDGDGTIDIAPDQPLVVSVGETGVNLSTAVVNLVASGEVSSQIFLPVVIK